MYIYYGSLFLSMSDTFYCTRFIPFVSAMDGLFQVVSEIGRWKYYLYEKAEYNNNFWKIYLKWHHFMTNFTRNCNIVVIIEYYS